MKLLHRTNSWSGQQKHSSYWNEYRQEGDIIQKVKCGRFKSFDGDENTWHNSERVTETWSIDDLSLPDWLKSKIE